MKFIIKFFPEITIKSKPVRKRYVSVLQNNISVSLKKALRWYEVKSNWDNIEVFINDAKNEEIAIDVLKNVPWIKYFIKVSTYDFIDFEDTYDKIINFYWDKLEWKRFVARAKRVWSHDFSSGEIERFIWWKILQNFSWVKVDLHNPEVKVSFEVRDNILNVIEHRFEWIWGYPVWVQDRALSLISWWFDSPVASFLSMKRWVKLDYVFFNLWWSAHEIWVKQISHYLWHTFSPSISSSFITVNFENVITQLLTKVHHKLRWVILKRLMLKVADKIHNSWDYNWIITWEALWQVSSQTLKNLEVITKASENLVVRPLITMDKEDIINISRRIWTHDFSANMPEYCWVVSDKPSTWAKLEWVLEEEAKLSDDLLDNIMDNIEVTPMYNLLHNVSNISKIEEVFEISDNDIVIDLRDEFRHTKFPLEDEHIWIPFYEINNRFKDLDSDKNYLFYCDKWIISNLHALYLKDKWFNNIKIYRP